MDFLSYLPALKYGLFFFGPPFTLQLSALAQCVFICMRVCVCVCVCKLSTEHKDLQ